MTHQIMTLTNGEHHRLQWQINPNRLSLQVEVVIHHIKPGHTHCMLHLQRSKTYAKYWPLTPKPVCWICGEILNIENYKLLQNKWEEK